MCLAVPGQIVDCMEQEAIVDFQGNRLEVSTLLTPDVCKGDWVLVHAGFAIAAIKEREALKTWDYLRAVFDDTLDETGAHEDTRRVGQ